jgi:hypothetical protein
LRRATALVTSASHDQQLVATVTQPTRWLAGWPPRSRVGLTRTTSRNTSFCH